MNEDRFKFRAWDGHFMDTLSGGSYYSAHRFFIRLELNGLNPILMQSTGIRDSKGTLIFEGDIVHIDEKGHPWYIEYGSFGDAQYYAVNGINSCRPLDTEYNDIMFGIRAENDTEAIVVGNIHENPEMMK